MIISNILERLFLLKYNFRHRGSEFSDSEAATIKDSISAIQNYERGLKYIDNVSKLEDLSEKELILLKKVKLALTAEPGSKELALIFKDKRELMYSDCKKTNW